MSTTKILWIQQKSTYQLYFIWQCLDLPHAFPTPLSPLPPLILQDSWAWSPTHPSNWFRFDSWLDISQVTPEQPRRIVIALQPACRHCPSACSICKKSNCFYFLLVLSWLSYYNIYSDGNATFGKSHTALHTCCNLLPDDLHLGFWFGLVEFAQQPVEQVSRLPEVGRSSAE